MIEYSQHEWEVIKNEQFKVVKENSYSICEVMDVKQNETAYYDTRLIKLY